MHRNKKTHKHKPAQKTCLKNAKVPRVRANPDEIGRMKPVWRIGQFDVDGPWGKNIVDLEKAWDEIFTKLKSYESMTWGDIDRNQQRDHFVSVDNIVSTARKRLEQLKIEQDELFRFRFSGTQRLWGIWSLNEFTILWWDPNHEICPSIKRHT